MCDLFSWAVLTKDLPQIERKVGDILFLDDEMMQAVRETNHLLDDMDSCVGHAAIAAYYHIDKEDFEHGEHPSLVPAPLADAILNGKLKRAITHKYGAGCTVRRRESLDPRVSIIIEKERTTNPAPIYIYFTVDNKEENDSLMLKLEELGTLWASGHTATEISYFGEREMPHHYRIEIDADSIILVNASPSRSETWLTPNTVIDAIIEARDKIRNVKPEEKMIQVN